MAPSLTTPKMPLHTPIPAVIKGLKVSHLYNMADRNEVPATVAFANGTMTVDEQGKHGHVINTFCSSACFQLVQPHKDGDEFSINIRHSCVEGWRMIFSCRNRKTLDALKDAVMRTKMDNLRSFNLLMDDRCALLDLQTRKLTPEQNQRIREETTAAIPKGSKKEFDQVKKLDGRVLPCLFIRTLSRCPAARSCTSTKSPDVLRFEAQSGEVTFDLANGATMETEADSFLPPRLVTPPSSDVAIYVCDSRDAGDFEQAWVFQVDKEHADALLEVLMHAWMEVDVVRPIAKARRTATKKNEVKEA